MNLRISEEPLSVLVEYATVSSSYDSRNPPAEWPLQFDLSRWGFITARREGRLVGGAVIAFDTPDVTMLEGRDDLAVLWDIRIAADERRQGIGSAVFRAVERWAIARNCTELKIETQHTNVPACRFYESRGCVLGAMHRFVYADFPDEIQMLWYKTLT